jgi:hypothetical protein
MARMRHLLTQYGEKHRWLASISARPVPPVSFTRDRRESVRGTTIARQDGMDRVGYTQQLLAPARQPEGAAGARLMMVPAVEWRSFLERFSRRHRGWLATVHGVERGVPVTRVRSAALESVTLEGRSPDHIVRLTFARGVSLCAPRPRGIGVQRTAEGAEAALEVETADDAFIRLAFRATALPEQLDGLAPAETSAAQRSAHH